MTWNGIPKPLTLDEKIAEAVASDRRYVPTQNEWDHATAYQRRYMTWPRNVLDWLKEQPDV